MLILGPGEPHSAASDGGRRADGRDSPRVVTNCDRGECPGDGREAGHSPVVVGPGPYHRPMSGSASGPAGDAGEAPWEILRRRSRVYPPEPPGRPGVCAVCRGPAGPGYTRCYQCARHELLGPGLLADAVVPVSYAVKGTAFAADLWRYKADRVPLTQAAAARTSLLALLLAFLRDHGPCVWRQAGMAAPGCVAVVPTGYGRPGPHPLLDLAAPFLRLPPGPAGHQAGAAGPRPRRKPFLCRTGPAASQRPPPRGFLGFRVQRPVRGGRAQARGGGTSRGDRARPSPRPGRPVRRRPGRPGRRDSL